MKMIDGFGSGRGTDYANQIKHQILKEEASSLRIRVGELEAECRKWKFEVEKLGVDPDYLTRMKDQVRRLELEAGDAQKRVRQKLEEISQLQDEAKQMQSFRDAFGEEATVAFFTLQDAWQVRQRPKAFIGGVLGFGGGVVASIVAAYAGLVLPGLG